MSAFEDLADISPHAVWPGATWCIPPNVPDAVQAGPEGASVVEVFAPARDDWEALERLEPSPPLWPVRPGRL